MKLKKILNITTQFIFFVNYNVNLIITKRNHLIYMEVTYAKMVQLYPRSTSSIIGVTTFLYRSICFDAGGNTWSKKKVLVFGFTPNLSLTVTSLFSPLHSTTE